MSQVNHSGKTVTWNAGADLSSGVIHSLLALDADARAIVTTANTDFALLGTLQNQPEDEFPAQVYPLIPGHVYEMVADDAITQGVRVTPITGGRVTDAGIGAADSVVGVAVTAVSNQHDVVLVLVTSIQISHA